MPRLFRKVIHVRAEDSPNVRLAFKQIELGKEPTHETLVPGVLSYRTYLQRRKFLDKVSQVIRLDGLFYEGEEALMYPPDWLDLAERRYEALRSTPIAYSARSGGRRPKSIGLDTGEGRDATVWSVIDELGLIEQLAMATPNTMAIAGHTISLLRKYDLEASLVCIDAGGGGKQIADRLREQGFPVRTVFFGAAPTPKDPRFKRAKGREKQREAVEDRGAYKNRRAEMYGLLRELLNPLSLEGAEGELSPDSLLARPRFALPRELYELRQELAIMPLLYDSEGKMYLPPKDKPSPNYTGLTIKQILGHSPDRADSLVLAVYGMVRTERPVALQAY